MAKKTPFRRRATLWFYTFQEQMGFLAPLGNLNVNGITRMGRALNRSYSPFFIELYETPNGITKAVAAKEGFNWGQEQQKLIWSDENERMEYPNRPLSDLPGLPEDPQIPEGVKPPAGYVTDQTEAQLRKSFAVIVAEMA